MDHSDDILRRAYARLAALKENLPKSHYTNEDYVKEYHEVLEQLTVFGMDLHDEFRIPADKIVPVVTSVTYDGEARYSDNRICQGLTSGF